jgi:hypothetical protein
MAPVVPLPSYPRGFLVLHEENLKLGQALGVSSKFLYAIHPGTMAYMVRRWRERGRLTISDLHVGDNTTVPLEGSDTIGVCLEYPDRRVYDLHGLANGAVVGTNATCTQVAVGVYAALITLLHQRPAPRIYFATDLYDTVYPHVLFSNQRVEHFVVRKTETIPGPAPACTGVTPPLPGRRAATGELERLVFTSRNGSWSAIIQPGRFPIDPSRLLPPGNEGAFGSAGVAC